MLTHMHAHMHIHTHAQHPLFIGEQVKSKPRGVDAGNSPESPKAQRKPLPSETMGHPVSNPIPIRGGLHFSLLPTTAGSHHSPTLSFLDHKSKNRNSSLRISRGKGEGEMAATKKLANKRWALVWSCCETNFFLFIILFLSSILFFVLFFPSFLSSLSLFSFPPSAILLLFSLPSPSPLRLSLDGAALVSAVGSDEEDEMVKLISSSAKPGTSVPSDREHPFSPMVNREMLCNLVRSAFHQTEEQQLHFEQILRHEYGRRSKGEVRICVC